MISLLVLGRLNIPGSLSLPYGGRSGGFAAFSSVKLSSCVQNDLFHSENLENQSQLMVPVIRGENEKIIIL